MKRCPRLAKQLVRLVMRVCWLLSLGAACSPPVVAQQTPFRGQIVAPQANRTIVNNNYADYSGYARRVYNYACVGCFPGAGAYDSAIAIAGIAAGASVINNIVNSATIGRPPQVVINQVNPVVPYQAPPAGRQSVASTHEPGIVAPPSAAYQAPAGCTSYVTGQRATGGATYVVVCQ